MPITIVCGCGKRLRVADELRGKQVRCPSCKAVLVAQEARAPMAVTRPAGASPQSAPKTAKSRAWVFALLGCGCFGLLTAGGAVVVVLLIALSTVKPSARTDVVAGNGPASGKEPNDRKDTSPRTEPAAEQTGLRLTPLAVDAKGLQPCLMWADNTGSAFYALDGTQGTLHRFSGMDYQTKQTTDLHVKGTWLAPSAEGLVLTVADREEVRLLDPATFAVKRTIRIPKLKRAVSAASLSLAVAWTETFGAELVVVDLRTESQTKVPGPKMLGNNGYGHEAVMAPDGRSLYTNALSGSIVRWAVTGNTIALAERGQRLHAGPTYPITVSADSAYVAQPCGAGNTEAGKSYATVILTANLQRQCVLDIGPYPGPLGFDVVNHLIDTETPGGKLTVFDLGSGVRKKEYPKFGQGDARQYLVHPTGKRFVVLRRQALAYVELKD
jgi:hypothetical protein